MAEFACHASDGDGRQCRHPAWGLTCYCQWHNAALSWRVLRMMSQPQRRSAGWTYYDPGMITNWEPPRFFLTGMVTFWVVALVAVAVGRWLMQIAPPPGSTPLDLLVNQVTFAAVLPVVAMTFGNSSRWLAQLFLAVAGGLVAAAAYRWLNSDAPVWTLKAVSPVGWAIGLFVLALPPPRGPIANANANVFDQSRLPPMNVGNSLVKSVGWVLLVSAGLSSLLLSASAPKAQPLDAGSSAKGDVVPAPKAEEVPPPAVAADTDPPPAPKGARFSLNNPLTAAVIFFIAAMLFANLGSFRSIRSEWHDQTIYHRCIMPSVTAVCAPPQIAGMLVGLGLFYALTRFALVPAYVGLIGGGVVCIAIAFFGAWRRGTRIYAANVGS